MKLLKKTKKGFTLVELVVVIAVVAILSGVGVGTYIAVTNNAKKSSDQQVLDQVNKCLMVHENLPTGGKPQTMQETLDVLDAEMGVADVQKLLTNTFSGYSFAWDKPQDRFVILEGDNIAYKDANYPSNRTYSGNENDFWKMVSTIDSNALCSQYVTGTTYPDEEVTVKAGLDLGNNLGITKVNYVREGATDSKDAIIRTNSKETTLTIESSTDIIKHYDVCGVVNIVEAPIHSYEEYGTVDFLEVKKGRVALQKGADVEKIHFDALTQEDFDQIIVAADPSVTLPEFSRDEVTIPNVGTLVVELQKDTNDNEHTDKDYIWLYQQGLVQQIRISKSATEISDVKATDPGVEEKTAKAADEIANNLKPGAYYSDEQIDAGEVEDNDVANAGLTEEEKAKIKQDIKDAGEAERVAKEKKDDVNSVAWNKNSNAYFNNLYDAFASAPVSGEQTTIVLLKDVLGNSNKNYDILLNQNVVFDLNGHTLNTVAGDSKTAYAIENKGTFTIKDSTDKQKIGTGTGKIELRAIDPDLKEVPGYASNVITNLGILTIESGLVYNASTNGGAAFAIDNGSGSKLHFKGGKAETAASHAIRLHRTVNGMLIEAEFTGGTIQGGGADIWVQTDGEGPMNILVDGVTCKDSGYHYALLESYAYENNYSCEGINWQIKSGTFEGAVDIESEIEISGGSFELNGAFNSGEYTISEYVYLRGDAVISGGKFEVICEEEQLDDYGYICLSEENSSITGGTFIMNGYGYICSSGTIAGGIFEFDLPCWGYYYYDYYEGAPLTITGGTYNRDPSDYVADGYEAVNNGDGTWTVVKK